LHQADEATLRRKIVELLAREGKPLTTEDICNRLQISRTTASLILYSLLREGVLQRVYTESYDPTRPFDTASWVVKEEAFHERAEAPPSREERKEKLMQLVISVPLSMLDKSAQILNQYEALDFHDAYMHIIEYSRWELKVMCPIIDAYALYPLVSKIKANRSLKVRVLTEIEKSKDVLYLLSLTEPDRVDIRDATKIIKYGTIERKGFGIHAKMIIADDEIALIGSFNLAKHHYLVNFDIGFLIHDRLAVRKLSQLFEMLWDYVSSNK